MALLNQEEINSQLNNLPGWEYLENEIIKEYELSDFSSALAFTVKVGIEAEKADHHPDILIHSYNMVTISLSTHSENGVTEKDFQLAAKIEKL